MHALRDAVITAILAAYAWVLGGVRPFSALSYLLIAVPSLLLIVTFVHWGGLSRRPSVVSAHYRARAESASVSMLVPWIVLLIAAAVLETIALSLGGRSTTVPTLSTAMDHLLATHWERALLCWAWLLTGVVPLMRQRRVRDSRFVS